MVRRIRNGIPVREVPSTLAPPEVTHSPIVDTELACPFCDRTYKTRSGRENHIEAKHTED